MSLELITYFCNASEAMQETNENPGFVYIITNDRHTTLYTGSTTNLLRRIYMHRNGYVRGFSQRYALRKLVFYETCPNMELARIHEARIKNISRKKKIDLINAENPQWQDLWTVLHAPSDVVATN
jgi:putative endonuclease